MLKFSLINKAGNMLLDTRLLFCVALSITLVAAKEQDPLGELEGYPYGIDLSKIEDELIDQATQTDDKIFLHHLLGKLKTKESVAVEKGPPTHIVPPAPILPPSPPATSKPSKSKLPFTLAEIQELIAFISSLKSEDKQLLRYYPSPAYQPPPYNYYPVSQCSVPPQMSQRMPLPVVSPMSAYNPQSLYPQQIVAPVYTSYRSIKK